MKKEKFHKYASTTSYWHAVDNEQNYDSRPNSNKSYSKTSIEYKFNKDGFRSDDFDLNSDINILFGGCSVTQGIGLPREETWPSQLLDLIKNHTNTNIPLWNVAECGASIDCMAYNLYYHLQKYNTPIDYYVLLLPSMHRKRFTFNEDVDMVWYSPVDFIGTKYSELSSVFSDKEYTKFVTLNNLKLIDAVARVHNSKVVVSFWHHWLKYVKETDTLVAADDPVLEPEEYELVRTNFPNWNVIQYPSNKFNTEHARDGEHPGPNMNKKIAEYFWERYFSKESLINERNR